MNPLTRRYGKHCFPRAALSPKGGEGKQIGSTFEPIALTFHWVFELFRHCAFLSSTGTWTKAKQYRNLSNKANTVASHGTVVVPWARGFRTERKTHGTSAVPWLLAGAPL